MQDTIKELSIKHNIDPKIGNQIINQVWDSIRKEISKGKGKNVLLAGFGNFLTDTRHLSLRIKDIKLKINLHEEKFQASKEAITYDEWIYYIEKWKYFNSQLNKYTQIQDTMKKRESRNKGERGL